MRWRLAVLALCLVPRSVTAAPLGPQKTLVVTVNQPGLTESARQIVFEWGNAQMAWNSNHRLTFVGVQHPTAGDAIDVTLNLNTPGCDATAAGAAQIEAAAKAAGYDPALYDREFLLIQDANCGNFNGKTISAKVMFFISWFDRSLAFHEFGHALGANHTDPLFCGSVPFPLNPFNSCQAYDMQAPEDLMGKGQQDYSAWWKFKIWGDPVPVITADGDYSLFPLDDGVLSAAEGLQIPITATTRFVLEWRPATDPGVRITWTDDARGHLYMLDMTPGENYFGNAGLPKGASWTDPNSGVTVQYVSSANAQATVHIGGLSAIPKPLTLSPSPYYHVDRVSATGQPIAVTYPLPTVSGGTGPYSGPTCSPASGTMFPVGGTYGNCWVTDSHQQTANTLLIVGVTTGTAPPPPVNCVVGPWSITAHTVVDTPAVTSGSIQTRTETTTDTQQRAILTQPANGGAACPVN